MAVGEVLARLHGFGADNTAQGASLSFRPVIEDAIRLYRNTIGNQRIHASS
jgi:hypothetical protein